MDDTPIPSRRSPGIRWLGIGAAVAALVATVTTWALWPTPRGRFTEPAPPPTTDAATPGDDVPSPETTSPWPSDELRSDDASGSTGPGSTCDPGCDHVVSDTCDSITDQVCDSVVEQSCNAVTTDVCSSGSSSTFPATGGQFLATAAAGVVVMPLMLLDRFAPKTSSRAGGGTAARFAVAAIGLYRRRLAPRTAITCRFTPTCSAYGAAVIERHGLITGARLAMRRIRRCREDVAMGTPDPPV
ncbi:putative membrane protein insertion efficiency factor [Stackebrandtia endophytica]|uniref:Putative membrane protein insertion efficiency factor n=1 Tax=Stackebrandtia endophytica TaxID=1496996 RepID=A0A543AXC5_9ACTN|nr:membrane protein insertion efficiency factor YidD [Stackebrandtia endophytica]TQL77226.1 putative membrane protein insertion efficiency factor [Stackebrandtia endophytica]